MVYRARGSTTLQVRSFALGIVAPGPHRGVVAFGPLIFVALVVIVSFVGSVVWRGETVVVQCSRNSLEEAGSCEIHRERFGPRIRGPHVDLATFRAAGARLCGPGACERCSPAFDAVARRMAEFRDSDAYAVRIEESCAFLGTAVGATLGILAGLVLLSLLLARARVGIIEDERMLVVRVGRRNERRIHVTDVASVELDLRVGFRRLAIVTVNGDRIPVTRVFSAPPLFAERAARELRQVVERCKAHEAQTQPGVRGGTTSSP